MYKRIACLLNEYVPLIKIPAPFMKKGYFRHSVHGDTGDNFEIFKDSSFLRFINFEAPSDVYGEEFFSFKIITHVYFGDQDSHPVCPGSEYYDPSKTYSFRKADFAAPVKVSLRWNKNVYISNDGIDAVIYRCENWYGYIIPKNMTQEEHFQHTLLMALPEHKLFDGIYELNDVKTFSSFDKENLGKIGHIELCYVDGSDEYYNYLENCLKYMVKLTRIFNEACIV